MHSTKKNSAMTLLVVATALSAQLASAQLTNSSFEQGGGSFTGWGTSGDTRILNNAIGSGATDGSFDAFLATKTDGSGGKVGGVPIVPAGNGATPSTIESFLNLPAGTLLGVGNGTPFMGSSTKQVYTFGAGDVVTFDYDFLTNQAYNDGTKRGSVAPNPNDKDFAFVTFSPVGSPAGAHIEKMIDTFYGYQLDPSDPAGFKTGFTITPFQDPFIGESGFLKYSITIPTAGQYVFGVGVMHASIGQENGKNSALLVDNFTIKAGVVPEPTSCLALAALTAGLLRRRKVARN